METSIKKTQEWIEQFVIHLNLCPFAGKPFEEEEIKYNMIDLTVISLDEALVAELTFLQKSPFETSFLIFKKGFTKFEEFWESYQRAEDLVLADQWNGEFQLVAFHSDFTFRDYDKDDIRNYTNRSPLPMIQILRTASVEKGMKIYGSSQEITDRNDSVLREKGIDWVKNRIS